MSHWARALVAFVLFAGCAQEPLVTEVPDGGGDDTLVDDTLVTPSDTPPDVGYDATPFPVRRLPCVTRSGLARDLPLETYGALEGEIVSIVPPGHKTCPEGPDHLHMQVLVGSKRYDVAVRIDSDTAPPMALWVQPVAPTLPDPGWATVPYDYERDLGVPSADFAPMARDVLLARLQKELATASRVRIFGRSYTDGTGTHNVHRNGRDRDGVLIIHRGEPDGRDRAIALRFQNQVF
ncbi:MAG: hypothetical protein HYV09_16455 [Deltaproteobacteria bacterium]|nr:hypothetical protein [Deltaproteobacteria bacterium]